ncbi:MAG TPA: C45 family peptidase [Acidimicrobiia bacterium]|nr:C45 family peptidase [Acidimicrobiia bacterium]
MRDRPIRLLELGGDAEHRGGVHGAAFHSEIRRYTEERVRLASNGTWAGRPATNEDAIALATSTLESHRRYDADLFEEMEAMALAGGISPAEAVIVGGFTDFVDIVRAAGSSSVPEEDDCTAVIVPDQLAGGRAGWLAQTWDMHDSATEHVVMLQIETPGAPRGLVYSTVGCLGQIGMNEAGIAVGINNLTASNGRVGVTWPFVVRKALKQSTLDGALGCVLEAELAGAHNYLLFDDTGNGFNVEAMPGYRAVTKLDNRPLVHTNHCLDPEAQTLEATRPVDLQASSEARLETAVRILGGLKSIEESDLIALTREAGAICRRSEPPYHTETAGAVLMQPRSGRVLACWGIPAENEFEEFKI